MLPTDKRFLNLNKLQKIVLAYKINSAKDGKFDVNKIYLDNLKAYINPEMYKKELEMTDPDAKKFEKYNQDFGQHSATGRQTGKPKLSPLMEKAIEVSNENRHGVKIAINNIDDFVEGKEKIYEPKEEPKEELTEQEVEKKKANLQEILSKEDETLG